MSSNWAHYNGNRHWGLLEGMDGVPYDKTAVPVSNRSTGYFWVSYYDRSLYDPEAFEFDRPTGENGYYVEQMDYLEPLTFKNGEETEVFKGYLTINNWEEGNPGSFSVEKSVSKSLTAEFRGNPKNMPAEWNPALHLSSVDESILSVRQAKGTYRVKIAVRASGNDDYLSAARIAVVIIRVK